MSEVIYHNFRKAAPQARNAARKQEQPQDEKDFREWARAECTRLNENPALRAFGGRLTAAHRNIELREVEREAIEALRLAKDGGDISHLRPPVQDFARSLSGQNPDDFRFWLQWNSEGWKITSQPKSSLRRKFSRLLTATLGL